MDAGKYTELYCNTAEDFLQELDEAHPRWNNDIYIFRGQNNANWPLLPTAMREGNFVDRCVTHHLEEEEYMVDGQPILELEQKQRELYYTIHKIYGARIIESFAKLASRSGFTIPYERRAGTSIFYNINHKGTPDEQIIHDMSYTEKSFYPYHSIKTALAQHHGVPTKLLDWTYRPLVAAFFASHAESKLNDDFSHLVVWAVRKKSLTDMGIGIVSHYPSDIGFLQQQDGIFTFDMKDKDAFLESGEWLPFECKFKNVNQQGKSSIFKFMLPYSEKDKMVDLLRLKQVIKPYLMPTLNNVAEMITSDYDYWKEHLEV